MNRLKSFLLSGLLITVLSVGLAQAQSKGAAEAFATGYEVYSSGDYKNAAAIYEMLLGVHAAIRRDLGRDHGRGRMASSRCCGLAASAGRRGRCRGG